MERGWFPRAATLNRRSVESGPRPGFSRARPLFSRHGIPPSRLSQQRPSEGRRHARVAPRRAGSVAGFLFVARAQRRLHEVDAPHVDRALRGRISVRDRDARRLSRLLHEQRRGAALLRLHGRGRRRLRRAELPRAHRSRRPVRRRAEHGRLRLDAAGPAAARLVQQRRQPQRRAAAGLDGARQVQGHAARRRLRPHLHGRPARQRARPDAARKRRGQVRRAAAARAHRLWR